MIEPVPADEAELESRVRALAAPHLRREGPLLPILHEALDAFGHVPRRMLPIIADILNLTRAEVYGVASFYDDFRAEPPGKHVLKLCRAEACQAMGGGALAAHAEAATGLGFGETSADGRLTLEETYCLGLCALAPAAEIDGVPKARLDAPGLDALIASCQS